jgi:hemolysin activation/secretion protein
VATRIVVLKVTEGKVGRLRVTNAQYHDIEKIKKKAPSLKEGKLPNFDDVTKDIIALNQWPDRRVTPVLRAGVTPGTVDVDLNVEDKLPFHGSVEYNNRYSPNTTPNRVNTTLKYDNLWQRGHSLSVSYQVAPDRPDDAEVFSGSYLARATDWTSILLYGVKSSSNISTIGGINVIGPGEIVGTRAVMTLPARENYFHSFSVGVDYKHFEQTTKLGDEGFSSPITYFPLSATYGGTVQTEGGLTQFSLGVLGNLREFSSDWIDFANRRYNANANFFHLNAELSHTQDVWEGFQLYGRVKGQYADGPMISSEQFSVGGADTVRGYLESQAVADNGVTGTFELRSPDIGAMLQGYIKDSAGKDEAGKDALPFTIFNEWRLFGFVDAGSAYIHDPLAEQQVSFDMWSYGVGSRFKLFDHLNGMAALAVPMTNQGETRKDGKTVLFSVSGEF